MATANPLTAQTAGTFNNPALNLKPSINVQAGANAVNPLIHTGTATNNTPAFNGATGGPASNPTSPYTSPGGTGGYQMATVGAPGGSAQPSGMTQFGAGNNLIGSQINPGASPRTATAQGQADQAASAYSNYQTQPFKTVNPVNTAPAAAQFGQANQQMQGLSTAGYSPVAGTDQSGARQYLGQAASSVGQGGNAGPGQMGSFGFAGDTGSARGMTLSQLGNVMNNTPDRGKLAADAYQLMQERQAPINAAGDRKLAERTAALGRVGSGMFNSDQMDLETQRNVTADQARRDLANNAAGLSLSDATDKLNAARGVTSDFGGLDLGAGNLNLGYQNSNNAERGNAFDRSRAAQNDRFGQNLSLANFNNNLATQNRNDSLTERSARNDAEAYGNDLSVARAGASRNYGSDLYGLGTDEFARNQSERNAGAAYDQQGFNNAGAKLGDLSNYASGLESRDLSGRNELRGERDYQHGLDREALGDRVNQYNAQEDAYNTGFGQNAALAGMGQSATNSYSGALGGAGANAQGQADSAFSGAGNLLAQWGQRRAQQPGQLIPPGVDTNILPNGLPGY